MGCATAHSMKAAEHQSNSVHSGKPEDTEGREVGMHDGARGVIIVQKVNVSLEKKKSPIINSVFLQNVVYLSLFVLTKGELI